MASRRIDSPILHTGDDHGSADHHLFFDGRSPQAEHSFEKGSGNLGSERVEHDRENGSHHDLPGKRLLLDVLLKNDRGLHGRACGASSIPTVHVT